MPDYLVKGEHLTAIADAYREALQTEDKISFPEGFAESAQAVIDSTNRKWVEGTLTSFEDLSLEEFRTGFFAEMRSLELVNLPALRNVATYGFNYTRSLKRVEFPEVTHVYAYAFLYSVIEVAVLPKLYYLDYAGFRNCRYLQELTIPYVEYISGCAFADCVKLEFLRLKKVNSFGELAFWNSGIKHLVLEMSTVPSIGYDPFEGSPVASGEGYIYVPKNLVESYKTTNNWKDFPNQFRALEDYTIDGTITGDLDETKI